MSLIGDTLAGLRRVMLVDKDVESLKARADVGDARYLDHERRLVRIETLIEFGRPRLPRG